MCRRICWGNGVYASGSGCELRSAGGGEKEDEEEGRQPTCSGIGLIVMGCLVRGVLTVLLPQVVLEWLRRALKRCMVHL